MDDRELRASLRRLPEARPGEAFTAEVLARVERDERRRAAAGAASGGGDAGPRWRPTLLAAGLAAALVAAAGLWSPGGGWGWPTNGGGEDGAAGAAVDARSTTGGEAAEAGGGEGGAPAGIDSERRDEEGRGRPAAGDEAATRTGSRGEGRAASAGRGGGAGGAADEVATPDARGDSPTGRRPGSPRELAPHGPPRAAGVRPETANGGRIAADLWASSPAPPRGAPTPAPSRGADFFASPPGTTPAADLATAERLARLRAERERLEARLAAFRRELPPAEPPVVLLGGDEGFDLVFDLGRWAPAGAEPAAARPAVHSTVNLRGASEPPRDTSAGDEP